MGIGNEMNFKIILKTKNEDNLIDIWIRYYSKMVGKENLIIFDNNSTSQKVLDVYKEHGIETIQIKSPNSIHSYHNNKSFYNELFASCDWFSILDTDEFLCVCRDGVFSAEGVVELLETSDKQVLGSIWLDHMHVGDSKEYFKINQVPYICAPKHNKRHGKAAYRPTYSEICNISYGHNACCKDAFVESGLFLLHVDRTNPEVRIKNCLDMSLANTAEKHPDVYKELQLIQDGVYNKDFLNKKFEDNSVCSLHKIREVQEYYLDKYSYIKKYYGTEREYIRTNIIENYIFGTEYKQEVASKSIDFLGIKN
jgi:hypothetical protein